MNFTMMAFSSLSAFNMRTKGNFKLLKIALVLMGSIYVAPDLQGHVGENKGRGLSPVSQEAVQNVEENWHTIVQVKPNKIGVERINSHRKAKGLAPLLLSPAHHAEEFVRVKGKSEAVVATFLNNEATPTLPSSVDNSQLPSFPPIGDQQQLGSCVAWGTTYYQATHEYGLLNGINNKSSLHNVFSPKWTYNNLNGGVDEGLDIFQTYQLFSQNGLVSLERLPYDQNYTTWDLNPQDWVSAISYRSSPGHLIAGIGGDTQNLQVIKQLLNNGHILTFGTFIDSWITTNVKKDPAASSNPHVGELAAAWMSGTDGGHCMTIVGYDDNVWIDINNNGKVDSGEKGAFLIANSWNVDWGNKGFVWIAYDAFLSHSAVYNGPSKNRVAIADAMNSYVCSAVPIAHNYSPQLIAQFTLSQEIRDQLNISVGVSDINSTTPSKVFNSYAVANQGGDLEFDGSVPHAAEIATFALDLTDLANEVSGSTKRFYLLVADNKKGNATVIESFEIIDNVNNQSVKNINVPLSLDDASKSIYIDYDVSSNPSPTPAPTPTPAPVPAVPVSLPPTLSIISPINNERVGSYVWMGASVQDPSGIERVEFYIDSVLEKIDTTIPYFALLGTQELSHGTHVLTIIAYNNKGLSTSKKVNFFVTHK